jgi:hypothetical protein
MEKEDPNELQICEFNGQDFELVADLEDQKRISILHDRVGRVFS